MVGLAFAAVALAALTDWIAVAGHRSRVEAWAKPAVMALLVLAVLSGDGRSGPVTALVVAALILSLIGDVLLLPAVDRFVPGLTSFLAAHVAYGAAFVADGVAGPALVAGAAVAVIGTTVVGRRIVAGAASQDEALGLAVVVYVVVLSAMWSLGIGTVDAWAVVGASLFAGSDAVLGWNRFVAPLARGRLATHVPYHTGQAALAAWAVF